VCAFQASGANHRPKIKAKTMKIIRKTIMVSALGLAPAINVNAQTNLQFTAATSTDEQAIRLTWASQSNPLFFPLLVRDCTLQKRANRKPATNHQLHPSAKDHRAAKRRRGNVFSENQSSGKCQNIHHHENHALLQRRHLWGSADKRRAARICNSNC
jgi:hypothetical protein